MLWGATGGTRWNIYVGHKNIKRLIKGRDSFIPQTVFFWTKITLTSNAPFSASFWSCALRFSEIIGQVLNRSFPGSVLQLSTSSRLQWIMTAWSTFPVNFLKLLSFGWHFEPIWSIFLITQTRFHAFWSKKVIPVFSKASTITFRRNSYWNNHFSIEFRISARTLGNELSSPFKGGYRQNWAYFCSALYQGVCITPLTKTADLFFWDSVDNKNAARSAA